VVGAIAPQLERAEIVRAKRKPTGSLDAYDIYLRGMAHFHLGTRDGMSDALPLFTRAAELDPEFASAYAMAAACLFWRKLNAWMTDPARETAEGARLARRAIELGKEDAVALARGGHAHALLTRDYDTGIELIDRALSLNPNLAPAWFLGGFVRIWRGEPDAAIERLVTAMRLSPLDSEMYRITGGMAHAHLTARRYDEAVAWAEKALAEVPTFKFMAVIVAAGHALAGRAAEAARAMQQLRSLDPALRLSHLEAWLPVRRPQDLATFMDGLRLAGLPE
jgi:tetratricopeptide (TPR) repeat protein